MGWKQKTAAIQEQIPDSNTGTTFMNGEWCSRAIIWHKGNNLVQGK